VLIPGRACCAGGRVAVRGLPGAPDAVRLVNRGVHPAGCAHGRRLAGVRSRVHAGLPAEAATHLKASLAQGTALFGLRLLSGAGWR
jgi:hypothetical protein